MRLEFVESLAAPVGAYWHALQARKVLAGRFAVASPLSSTPLPVYAWLSQMAAPSQQWHKVDFVLMDEQVDGREPPFTYVAPEDQASYEAFARRHLLAPLEKQLNVRIPVVKPTLATISDFTHRIDLLILALGVHGNYANVMPGTALDVGWHIPRLSSEFRHVHTRPDSQSYSGATFREFGMSLGPQQVLAAGEVIVIVSGSSKLALTRQLLSYDRFDERFPLSIIHHRDVSSRVAVFVTHDVGLTDQAGL